MKNVHSVTKPTVEYNPGNNNNNTWCEQIDLRLTNAMKRARFTHPNAIDLFASKVDWTGLNEHCVNSVAYQISFVCLQSYPWMVDYVELRKRIFYEIEWRWRWISVYKELNFKGFFYLFSSRCKGPHMCHVNQW